MVKGLRLVWGCGCLKTADRCVKFGFPHGEGVVDRLVVFFGDECMVYTYIVFGGWVFHS